VPSTAYCRADEISYKKAGKIMSDVKYPKITAKLVGEDSNAMVLIAAVRKALRRGGVAQAEIDAFTEEATSGDYGNVLTTCERWVNVS
jgi:hypothetical protein